ncbi:MAG: PKD domain-containing protein [Chitinophagaceae bacterium]
MNRLLTLIVYLYFTLSSFGQTPVIKHPGTGAICAGQSLVLTVDGAATGATFKWRKDGVLIVPAETLISYTANTTGNYDVIVTAAAINDTLAPVKVTVNPNPVSGFTFTGANQCGNLPISFANSSTGTALDYAWTFGDPRSGAVDNISDLKNPKHTFIGTSGNATQSFTVSLTATDNKGCKDNATAVVTMKQIPGTQLDGTGYTIYNGLPYFTICNETNSSFEFLNISSTKATNTNYIIKWGDATTDFNSATFNAPITHDYSVGKHVLQFIVSGQNGCKDTAIYNVFVGSNPAVGLGNPGNTIICTGTSLTFPISSTSSNPPGTVYTVTFNDGTSPIVYNHPAPDDVTHRFDEGSCGVFSGTFNNSFSAMIVASNPCATSAATVVPIYVSKKANADFSISPDDTTCVNTTITLTNIGTNASVISSQGQCIPGRSVWHIAPATGWTTTGSLGSDAAANPAQWTAGDKILPVIFTVPGVYIIKLKTGGNSLCGFDEIEKTICVNPKPVAAFNVNQASGCLPLTVTTVNNSNTPSCGNNTYTWTVSYSNAGGCTPAASDYSFINGTSAISANPQIRFNSPGVYTLRLVTSSQSSACISAAVTKEITVKTKPTVAFSIPASICQNSSINPVSTVNNCYATDVATNAWTFTNGLPDNSTAGIPGNIVYNTDGTYNISLAITNECGTTTTTKSLLVKPTPDVSAPANQSFCPGSVTSGFTFSTTSPGATYKWTNSNTAIGLSASGTGNIAAFTATNNGSAVLVANITVTPSLNGCEGVSKQFSITVNPKPIVPTVSSPVTYCEGETAVPLTATATTGNDLLWYTVSSGGTGSTTAPTPNTALVGNISWYVSQTNNITGCESARSLITVTIKQSPKITTSSSANPTICASANGSIILNGLTPNTTYNVKYNKNSAPVSVMITSNSSSVVTISGLSAGTYSNVMVVRNGCPSNEVGPFTLADPNPPATPTAGSNSPLCSGVTLNLTASTTATGNILYSWSGPNNFTSNDQNPVIAAATVAANGDYTVTVSLNGCSASKTISIIVNPKPTKPIVDRPVVYCLNATATALTATAAAGNTLTWYDNKNLTNGSTTAPTPSTATAGTIIYYVNQTNGLNCTSDTSAITVTVYPLITGNTIGANQTLCTGNTPAPLSGTTVLAGGNGLFDYQWQASTDNGTNWTDINNATADSYSPGIINVTTKYRRVVSAGPCTNNVSNVVTKTIQGTLTNYDIAASQTICEGGQSALLNGQLPTGGSGSFIYQWENSLDNNTWTPILNSNSQNYQPPVLTTTTHYQRKVTSGSCSAYSSKVIITVNPKPVMTPVANLIYCNSSSVAGITFNSIPSANVTYSWTNDNTTIGLGAAGAGNLPAFNTINNTKLPITGNITITPTFTANNVNCAGTALTFKLTVLPAVTITSINNEVVCTGSTIPAYTPIHDAVVFSGASVSYSWTVNGAGITLTTGTGNQIPSYNTINNGTTHLVATINVTPKYTYNGVTCDGAPVAYTITVKPGVTNNVITADQDICINTPAAILQGSLPTGGNGGFQYQWQKSIDGGNTWIDVPGATGTNYDPGVLSLSTMYQRNVTTNLCTGPGASSSNAITINVNQDAKAVFMPLKDTGCAPFVLDPSVIALKQFPQNGIYNWYANGNFIGVGTSFPGYTITNSKDSVTIKLVAISGHGCKPDSMDYKFYTYITPAPSFSVSLTEGCGPLGIAVNNTTPEAALFTYAWDFGNGQTSTAAQPGDILFDPNPNYGDTTYIIGLKVISWCEAITVTKSVKVKSKPKALFAPNISVGCSPMSVTFNNTSGGVGNTYNWDFGDGSTLNAPTADPVTHIFNSGVRDTFYVKLKAVNECGADSLQYAIVVSPNKIKLDFAVNGDEESGCSPHSARFINNSTGASNFTWDFGDGNIISTQKNIDTILHNFTLPGTYVVKLRATNGCSDTTSTETIIVYPSPRAAFTISAACLSDTVRFTNLSDSATSYEWQFGDGTISTEKNPTHKYKDPGVYTVILKAFRFNTPGSVCTDSISKQLQLGPTGELTYTGGFLCGSRAAVFQVQTNNSDTLIFNFGDGTELKTTSNIAYHSYPNAGTYLPSVTLKNRAGCEIVLPGFDPIKADKIKAGFYISQLQLCGSTKVSFIDTSHSFFGKASIRWDFGDGTTGNGFNNNHVYASGGIYPIEMIVFGNSGCSDTVRQSISVKVNNKPIAAIQSETTVCAGNVIPFISNIQSADAINIIQWSISNGVTNANPSFSYTFSQPGNYTVRLIAGTVNGCFDTAIQTIRVNPSPTVRASNDVNLCLGTNTRLIATGINPVNWSPTQGLSCITCPDPIATPIITTSYVVQTTNNFGCSGYDTVVVTVIQPLQLSTAPDDSICIGQSSNLLASGATSYNWTPTVSLNNSTISNPTATPVVTTKYRVVGYDGYSCFTDTAYILVAVGQYPTVSLGPDLVLSTGTQHPLASTIQNGPISNWSWNPPADLNCNSCPLPVATIKKDISYTVNVTNNYGCNARDTINIKVFCENTQVFIPNAFTPDDDGINDILMVQGTGIVMVKSFRVFNRWGELVFERSSFAPNAPAYGWNGKIKGVAGGPDVFVYTAEVVCENGVLFNYKGNVSIIK